MLRSGLNSKKGFTVAEVLTAVLIIVVLCGIAAPNVVRYKKSLDNMDLETTAKEIGFSVQNKLAGVKTSGSLNPEDLGGPLSGSGDIYSFSSTDYKGPLMDVTLSSLEGSFTVSFSIKTGDVNLVRYTKSGKTGEWSFTGQSIASDFGNDELTMEPVVSVDNGNEIALVVRINDTEKGGKHLSQYFSGCSQFSYDVTLTGCDESGEDRQVTLKKSGTGSENHGTYVECRIVLTEDDLEGFDLNSFIGARVESSYAPSDGIVIRTDTAAARNETRFHGLFGNGSIGNVIEVRCQRHLLNLTDFDTEMESVAVIQTDNIVLDSDFSPVHSDCLFGDSSNPGIAEYNGNGKSVTGLTITGSTLPDVGFFAYTNCCIKDLVIVAPSVTVPDIQCSAGALCGTVYNGEISGCEIVNPLLNAEVDGSAAGALCGTVLDGAISSCTVSGGGQVFGSMFSGGLIGRSGPADISVCASTADIRGDLYLGGFAGSCDGTHVSLCSASGGVYCVSDIEGAYSGGFAGYMDRGCLSAERICEFSECVASGNVASNDYAGGFAGFPGGIVEKCFSLGKVTDDEGFDEAEYLGGFCPLWVDPATGQTVCYFTDCYYKCAPGWNDKFTTNPEGVRPNTSV